jgi:hypothetical protein
MEAINCKTNGVKRDCAWDILTCLRSEDVLRWRQRKVLAGDDVKDAERMAEWVNEKQQLKILTVGRLRSVVCLRATISGLLTTHWPLSEGQREQRKKLLHNATEHFQSHWRCAVEAVKVLFKYDLDKEVKVK